MRGRCRNIPGVALGLVLGPTGPAHMFVRKYMVVSRLFDGGTCVSLMVVGKDMVVHECTSEMDPAPKGDSIVVVVV